MVYDLLLQVLMKNYTCSRTKLTPLPVYTMICTRKCTRLTKHERTTWWFMDFGLIFCLKSNPNWRPKSTKYSNTIYKSLVKFKRPKLLAYWPVRKSVDVVQWSSTSPISGNKKKFYEKNRKNLKFRKNQWIFYRDREEILSKSKLLRGSNVYITEDLSRKLREHRNELTKFMREVSLNLANNHK